jgi:transposase, IS5 family
VPSQAGRRRRKAGRSRSLPFGYKNHIGIGRAHGLIRTGRATEAARHDGAQLPIDRTPPATFEPIPLTARRRTKSICQERLAQPGPSQEAEGQADARGHRKSQRKKSKVRAFVEPVFARQKGLMGMFIRTIGLARATMKIGLANLTYNMKRMLWLMTRSATA